MGKPNCHRSLRRGMTRNPSTKTAEDCRFYNALRATASVRVIHSLSVPASLREELVCERRRVRDSHPNGRGLPLLQGKIFFPYPPQRAPFERVGTQLRRWPFA